MSRSVVAVTLRRSSVRRYRFHVTLALLMRRPAKSCRLRACMGVWGEGGGRVRGGCAGLLGSKAACSYWNHV